MSIFREFETGVRIAWARLVGQRIPFFVQLMPTERCNLKCSYCYAEFGSRRRPDFPLTALLEVIDGLARLGTRFVMLAGGEPMLRRDIGVIVNRIIDDGMVCSVNTNGIGVPARMDEISRADMLSISLDGPPELHDRYRGAGTYDKALEAVKAARAHSVHVQLQFTLTRDLKEAFLHVEEVAERRGCFIGINFLRPQKRVDGTFIGAAEASDDEVEKFLDWLIKEKPRSLPYSRHLLEYVRRWPYSFGHHIISDKESLRNFKPIPCAAGKFLIAIDNTGDIYPCTKLFYTHPLGNCADGNIEKAWAELKSVRCEACLDLGCNLINDLFRFHPASIAALLQVWFLANQPD